MESAPAVELSNITRRFGDVEALRDISLTIQRGEFFSLLGPSGCGKTTLLRIIAGLDFPDRGSLRLTGKDSLHVPAHERPTNTVFQSYALFPHLSIRDNVAFGLRMKRFPQEQIESRVRTFLEMARITELAKRRPSQLSGGQRQRVALARALINEPAVLLLDEPLGALDLKLRKELQQELRTLQRRTGITFIYVTHDQDEALSMSDRIAVMNHGAIIQLGSPRDLYEKPCTAFVAQFLGGCNLLPAQVRERSEREMVVTTPVGNLRFDQTDPRPAFKVAIRPEKIHIARDETINRLAGRVLETTYTGAETHCIVQVAGEKLRVASVNAENGARLKPGDNVELTIPPEALVVLED